MSELRAILRSHARHPAVAVGAAVSMGIGVGTATVMFSLMHALLMRPLEVPNADAIFRLSRDASGESIFSYPEVVAIKRVTAGRAAIVAHQVNEAVVRWGDGSPVTAWFEIVEPGYFEAFDVDLAIGAGFTRDGTAGRQVVVSHGTWVRLGSDASLVGQTLSANGEAFIVVGVAPVGFKGTLPGFPVELWVALDSKEVTLPLSGSLDVASDRFLVVSGRLEPGVTVAEVRTAARAAVVEGADPDWAREIVVERAAGLLPGLQAGLRPVFVLLSIMVGTVVLIACANVAGLLLTRGAERLPELALRGALGASPARLLASAAVDGLVIGVPSALATVLTAWIFIRVVAAVPLPAGVPIVLDPRLDSAVLVFGVSLALTATLLASLGPGWVAARDAGGSPRLRSSAGRRTATLRRVFVGGQVAIATLLLSVAGLMARGIGNVADSDPGFRVDGIVTVTASVDRMALTPEALKSTWDDALRVVRATPGVREAGAILFAPMGGRADRIGVEVPGSSWSPRPVLYNLVSEGALETLDLTVGRGRPLTYADGRTEGTVPLLVNETLAREAFPDGAAVGRTVVGTGLGPTWVGEVVGVVADATYRRLGEGPTPHVYLPFGRFPRGDMIVLARTDRAMDDAIPDLIATVRALDPDLLVTGGTMPDAVDESTFWSRVVGAVVMSAGLGGLLLAVVGLFGTVSYEAERRVREVAIRRAVGASAGSARRLLLFGSVRVTAVGIGLGSMAAVLAAGLLRGLLHGVPPHDPITIGGIASALLAVTIVAAFPPAGRATRVQPAAILKRD